MWAPCGHARSQADGGQAGLVHVDAHEQDVVRDVVAAAQSGVRREQRATGSDVHVRRWPAETGTSRVRQERVLHGRPAGLVEQPEADLLAERPAEQRVVLTAHDDEEQRQVRLSAQAVAVRVRACAELVAEAADVERGAVDGRRLAALGFLESASPQSRHDYNTTEGAISAAISRTKWALPYHPHPRTKF